MSEFYTHSRCHGSFMRVRPLTVNKMVMFYGYCPKCNKYHFYDKEGFFNGTEWRR